MKQNQKPNNPSQQKSGQQQNDRNQNPGQLKVNTNINSNEMKRKMSIKLDKALLIKQAFNQEMEQPQWFKELKSENREVQSPDDNPKSPKKINSPSKISPLKPKETGAKKTFTLGIQRLMKQNRDTKIKSRKKLVKSIQEYEYLQQFRNHETTFFIELTEVSGFEKSRLYHDDYPFLTIRKLIMYFFALISYVCYKIIKMKAFDNLVLAVIVANTVSQALTSSSGNNQDLTDLSTMEWFFLIFYTVEMCLKILGLGLFMGPEAYLKDYMNFMDIVIVLTSWLPFFINSKGVNLSTFRTFRVLRPLRTIKNIKALRKILLSIILAIPILKDTFIIQWFNYLIFAIAGLQLMKGSFRQRCFNIQYGLESGLYGTDEAPIHIPYCKVSADCNKFFAVGAGQTQYYHCGKHLQSLKWNTENYDNILYAFIQVYQVISLEGWSDIMLISQRTYNTYIFVFYWMAIVIGAHFLQNLTIAVLGNEFANAQEKIKEEESQPKKKVSLYESYNLKKIQFLGLYPLRQFEDMGQLPTKKQGVVKSKIDMIFNKLKTLKSKIFTTNKIKNDSQTIQQKDEQLSQFQENNLQSNENRDSEFDNRVQSCQSPLMNAKERTQHIKQVLLTNIQLKKSVAKSMNYRQRLEAYLKKGGSSNSHKFQDTILNPNDFGQDVDLNIEDDLSEMEENQDMMKKDAALIKKLKGKYMKKVISNTQVDEYTDQIDQILPMKKIYIKRLTQIKDQKEYQRRKFFLQYFSKYAQYYYDARLISQEREKQQRTDKLLSKLKRQFRVVSFIHRLKSGSKQYQDSDYDNKQGQIAKIDSCQSIQNQGLINNNDENQNLEGKQDLMRQQSIQDIQSVLKINQMQEFIKSRSTILNIYNMEMNSRSRKKLALFNSGNAKKIKKNQLEVFKDNLCNNQQDEDKYESMQDPNDQLFALNIENINELVKLSTRKGTRSYNKFGSMVGIKSKQMKIKNQNYNFVNDIIGQDQLKDLMVESQLGMIELSKSQLKQVSKIDDEYLHKFVTMHKDMHSEMVNQKEFYELRSRDQLKDSGILRVFWSGDDLFGDELTLEQKLFYKKRFQKILQGRNYSHLVVSIWTGKTLKVILNGIHNLIYKFAMNNYFDYFILLCVCLNTLILSLEGTVNDNSGKHFLELASFAFTITFTVEAGLKIIALGFKNYVRDKINLFDLFLVTISWIEYQFASGNSGFSAFRTLRIFRVLRVTRLIRSLKYMRIIMRVLSSTISSAIYIGLLLLLFIVIYAILGMNFYHGRLTKTNGIDKSYRHSFDDFTHAFMAIFQMMTIENWNQIMTACLTSTFPIGVTMFYLLSCQLILAYVLNNLFQAILLQGFEDKSILDDQAEEVYDDIDTHKQNSNRIVSQEDLNSDNDDEEIEGLNNKDKGHDDSYDSDDGVNHHNQHGNIKKNIVMFNGIRCHESLFLFSQNNRFRIITYKLVKNNKFDFFILFLIVLSSIQLAVVSYQHEQSKTMEVLDIFDYVFTWLFFLEFLLKIIAYGFFYDKNSYLRDSWNQLDFIIVAFSMIEFFQGVLDPSKGDGLVFVKILRLMRVLRPLRFISRNQNMKLVVIALLESFGGIANVVIVIALCMLMLSILGINILGQRMGYCDLGDEGDFYGVTKQQCANNGKEWKTYPWNMDKIDYAMLSIFVFATLEGWNDLVYTYIDSNYDGPVYDGRLWIFIYNMVVIYLCAFIFVGLFVGVIFLNYILAEEKVKNQNLTADQQRWINLQLKIIKEKPDFGAFRAPQSIFRKPVYKFLIKYRNYFDNTIMFVIIANIVVMCMTYDDEPESYTNILKTLNTAFIIIFLLECIIKIYGLGFLPYIYKGANRFDFFLVILSIGDFIMDNLNLSSNKELTIAPQIARIFRVLRVTRVFKLIKSFKGLSQLIETTLMMIPAMFNVFALILIVFFIFAVLGTSLFKDVPLEGKLSMNSENNFANFGNSYIMMFRMSTGEDWHLIMYDCMEQSKLYFLYYVIYVVLIQWVLINLFVLVIIREFNENFYNTDNPLNQYATDIEVFKQSWNQLTIPSKGQKLHQSRLIDFFLRLQKPLGLGIEDYSLQQVKDRDSTHNAEHQAQQSQQIKKIKQIRSIAAKVIMKMNIRSDKEKYVYFNDIVFCFMKRGYSKQVQVNLSQEGQKIIKEAEIYTGQQLFKIKQEIWKSELKSINKRRNTQFKISLNNHNQLIDQVNPLLILLYSHMCFNSWRKYSQNCNYSQLGVIKQSNCSDESDYDDDEDDENDKKKAFKKMVMGQSENSEDGPKYSEGSDDFVKNVKFKQMDPEQIRSNNYINQSGYSNKKQSNLQIQIDNKRQAQNQRASQTEQDFVDNLKSRTTVYAQTLLEAKLNQNIQQLNDIGKR